MKKITTRVFAVLCLFLTILSCSEDEELIPTEIVLTPSSASFLADGNDVVTFQVEVFDGNAQKMSNVDYGIYVNGELLESRTFKTDEVGEYRVVAKANNLESNQVVLNATDPAVHPVSINLAASSGFLVANGENSVTFEVEVFNGSDEIIEDAPYEIFINGEVFTSDSFTTTDSGEYEVVARIDELESNVLMLEAIHPDDMAASIELSASATTFMADGNDAVTFDVKVFDKEDELIETDNYEIYINDEKLESSSFTTTEKGEYEVVARIADVESNKVVLKAITLEDLAASIELSASKTKFMADGDDSVTFEVQVFDEDHNRLEGVDYEILVDGEIWDSSKFSTTTKGSYKVVARVQDVESNEIVLNAITREDLVISLELESNVQLIVADGTSGANLEVRAFDENNQEVPNVNFELLVQGSEYDSSTFKTTQADSYKIIAKVNEVTSNELIITARENKTYSEITVPVIFHIGHFGEEVGTGNNVKAELLEGLMEGLNRGFANKDGSVNPNAVDTHIRFRMATLDPDNNTLSEPGINRIDISAFDIGPTPNKEPRPMPVPFRNHNAAISAEGEMAAANEEDIPDDGELGLDESYEVGKAHSWPRSEYLNVYVFPIQENLGRGGYAYYPFVTQSNGLEGFNVFPEEWNVTFGKNEGNVIHTNVVLYQHTSTLVHEVGHNLALYHNFSEDNCNTSDFCEDTYSYNYDSEKGSPDRDCSDNKGEIVHDNYMDYEGIYNTFTYEQRERMRLVFEYGYFYKDLKNSKK